jgi:hypothetical protein
MGLLFERGAADRERRQLAINFVSPRQATAPVSPNYRLIRTALVAGFALLVGSILLGRIALADAVKRRNGLVDAATAKLKQQMETEENARRLKAVDEWDGPVWLDEMYDLARRIKDVNRLRVTSVTAEPLPRNNKSRYAAKVFIKGTLLDRRDPRGPLDDLVSQFTREGYSPAAPKVEGNQFSLTVSVARRAPETFGTTIDMEGLKKSAPPPRMDFGKGKDGKDAKDGEDGDENAEEQGDEKAGARPGRDGPGGKMNRGNTGRTKGRTKRSE